MVASLPSRWARASSLRPIRGRSCVGMCVRRWRRTTSTVSPRSRSGFTWCATKCLRPDEIAERPQRSPVRPGTLQELGLSASTPNLQSYHHRNGRASTPKVERARPSFVYAPERSTRSCAQSPRIRVSAGKRSCVRCKPYITAAVHGVLKGMTPYIRVLIRVLSIPI